MIPCVFSLSVCVVLVRFPVSLGVGLVLPTDQAYLLPQVTLGLCFGLQSKLINHSSKTAPSQRTGVSNSVNTANHIMSYNGEHG